MSANRHILFEVTFISIISSGSEVMYDDGLPVLGADDLVDVQRAALPLDVLLQLQLAAHQSPLLLLRAGRRLVQSESAERETHNDSLETTENISEQ